VYFRSRANLAVRKSAMRLMSSPNQDQNNPTPTCDGRTGRAAAQFTAFATRIHGPVDMFDLIEFGPKKKSGTGQLELKLITIRKINDE